MSYLDSPPQDYHTLTRRAHHLYDDLPSEVIELFPGLHRTWIDVHTIAREFVILAGLRSVPDARRERDEDTRRVIRTSLGPVAGAFYDEEATIHMTQDTARTVLVTRLLLTYLTQTEQSLKSTDTEIELLDSECRLAMKTLSLRESAETCQRELSKERRSDGYATHEGYASRKEAYHHRQMSTADLIADQAILARKKIVEMNALIDARARLRTAMRMLTWMIDSKGRRLGDKDDVPLDMKARRAFVSFLHAEDRPCFHSFMNSVFRDDLTISL